MFQRKLVLFRIINNFFINVISGCRMLVDASILYLPTIVVQYVQHTRRGIAYEQHFSD